LEIEGEQPGIFALSLMGLPCGVIHHQLQFAISFIEELAKQLDKRRDEYLDRHIGKIQLE
jgi:hypothetical protein